ncbi:MAG: YerC/YecD family TrpR-related protein [Candidatus Paceibacterota bacterium]|jgi:TrpR-related protein YerC/YecD
MNWSSQENKILIEAILSLESKDEAKRFLRDLLTEGEITELAKRLQTAEMLSKKVPYSVIEKETGFSSTTVARVAKWLNNGEGGYKLLLNKIHHSNKST